MSVTHGTSSAWLAPPPSPVPEPASCLALQQTCCDDPCAVGGGGGVQAEWVRAKASEGAGVKTCDFFEAFDQLSGRWWA
jgi:hypothetical protein